MGEKTRFYDFVEKIWFSDLVGKLDLIVLVEMEFYDFDGRHDFVVLTEIHNFNLNILYDN